MKIYTLFLSVFILIFFSIEISAQSLKMNSVFSDGMILQRDKPIVVKGIYLAGKNVVVSFFKVTKTCMTNSDGFWQAEFKPMKAGGPYVMNVLGEDGESIQVNDILIGDVWLCAGQSNMNFMLSAEKTFQYESTCLNNPYIREYRAAMPEGLYNPESDEHSQWRTAMGAKAKLFSAVAYFFAKQIQQSEKIPVGILVIACGGARVEAFVDYEALKNNSDLLPLMNYWKDKIDVSPFPKNHMPGKFFAEMIQPILPFSVKGVLFYQGESNTLADNSGRTITERANEYETILKSLIANWRQTWKDATLPFYLVQLPNYIEKKQDLQWAVIRQAQLNALKNIPNTGLVVTIDVGDSTDIHPTDKKTVGERAARWALANVYGHNEIVVSGPVVKDVKVKDKQAVVSFIYTAGGLKKKDALTEFEISDRSNPDKFVTAQVRLEGDQLILFSEKVQNPAAVRYAWKDNPKAELFNTNGLPASPFVFLLSKSH